MQMRPFGVNSVNSNLIALGNVIQLGPDWLNYYDKVVNFP